MCAVYYFRVFFRTPTSHFLYCHLHVSTCLKLAVYFTTYSELTRSSLFACAVYTQLNVDALIIHILETFTYDCESAKTINRRAL